MRVNKYYKVDSVEDRATLLGILYSYGAIFHRFTDKFTLEKACKEFTNFPVLNLENNGSGFDISGTRVSDNDSLNWPSQAKEILKELKEIFVKPKPIIISNVGDYKATICEDGIKVGCQTISFAKFQEIVDGVSKYKAQ